jgi:hypothetical protein
LPPLTNKVRPRMSEAWNDLCDQAGYWGCLGHMQLIVIAGFYGGRCEGKYFQEADPDGVGNALQHALWNALMARKYGEQVAEEWASAQEPTRCGALGTPSAEEAMDCANNAIGREVGMTSAAQGLSSRGLAALIAAQIRTKEKPYVLIDEDPDQCPNGW